MVVGIPGVDAVRVATCTRCRQDREAYHDHAHRAICEPCAKAEGAWVVPLECDDDTAADHCQDGPQ
jgi:hypothetical protein